MSKESRQKRGIEYAAYKVRRDARNEGRKKAREQFTNNWKSDQKKIGEVIGAIEEYYGDDNFHRSQYTSEELIDEYERIFVKNKSFSPLKKEDIDEANRELERRNIPAQISLVPEEARPIAVDLSGIKGSLQGKFGF